MKELLIGMGLGFVAGAVVCKLCKPFGDTVEKGIDKTKEIAEDIADEVQAQTRKKQNVNE